jgi:MarR family transcriptional regulator, transcriptional regulator for hemolysin
MAGRREAIGDEELRSVIGALGRSRAAFFNDTASFFMDMDTTMAQFRALAVVRRWGKQSGRELARRLHVTPGTLVPMIDRLEELGYLRRVPDLVDRRTTWLELTPKADRLFQRMWGMGAARLASAVGQLVPRDRAELVRLLNKVAAGLEASVAAATEHAAPA